MNNLFKLSRSVNFRNSQYSVLFILIIVNVIVFIPVIILHHSFLLDDYLIFSKIKHNIYSPISFNPSEEFFLFLRPLVYFYFWINYNLWHTYAIGMKVTSLFFHLTYVSIFFLSILRLRDYLELHISNSILLLIAIAFSLYPDHLISIVWISNVTELLSSLFYAISLLSVFKYLTSTDDKKYLIYIYFISFIFSILSKQQGIHLPLLILMLIFIFKKKFPKERINKVLLLSFISIFILILFSILNFTLYSNDLINFSEFILKKPFSLIGTITYVVNPVIGAQLYSFFILHKVFALILLIILLVVIIYLIRKKNIYLKSIFISTLLICIIFYPRIFAEGGNRLNSILVYWFYIGVAFFVILKYSKFKIFIIILLISLNLFGMISYLRNDLNYLEIQKEKISNLSKLDRKYGSKLYVLIAPDIALLPYQLYFFNHNEFGKSDLNYSPINIRALVSSLDGLKTKKITCSLKGDSIFVSVILKNIFLKINAKEINEVTSKYTIVDLAKSKEERDNTYRSLNISISDSFLSSSKLIFFDGENWKYIN